MTMMTRMTASRPKAAETTTTATKSDKGAGRRQHKSDINIINDHWTAGTTKRAVDKTKQQPTIVRQRRAGGGLRKEQRATKRGRTMPTRRK
jgi:hypothetical protein